MLQYHIQVMFTVANLFYLDLTQGHDIHYCQTRLTFLFLISQHITEMYSKLSKDNIFLVAKPLLFRV